MTVPAVSLTPRTEPGLGVGASAGELLDLASRDDFHRWETQLATTGNCAHPIRLQGRIDAIDRATGQAAPMYDTDGEPGGVLLVACGNRREHICPACSDVYKNDARQIIRSGLTGGKGMPGSVAAHPCVFATLTAPGFGPVHTIRTGRAGRLLACRPRRDAHQRRCPHGRDISCPRHHHDGDPRLGQPLCPDCYDYTGHILFNALAPEIWRRFTIYLPRQLARIAGITQRQLCQQVRVRFVKVAEYQARGLVHYHAVIRLDATSNDYQPPPAQFTAALLTQAIQRAAVIVSVDSTAYLTQATCRASGWTPGDPLPVIDPGLGRILRFGTQIDTRVIRDTGNFPGTGAALSPQAVANYIAKYATKTISAPGLPHRPLRGPAAIAALTCGQHYKRLISVCWDLGKHPDAGVLGLNRWTHMLGYRGHFLTKSRCYSVTFTRLRQDRITYRHQQHHPNGEKDPWGRHLDDRIVLVEASWHYAGTGHATTAERALALAAAARAREHKRIAREETWTN
jgi:Replication initiator protein, pSAM2